MKFFGILPLAAVFMSVCLTLNAQTNTAAKPKMKPPVISPGQTALNRITAQKTILEKRLKLAQAVMADRAKHYNLKSEAESNNATRDSMRRIYGKWQIDFQKTQIRPLEQGIAKLKLMEFETRKNYKIPEPKKTARR